MAANKRHISEAIKLNAMSKPEGYKYCTVCVQLKPYSDYYSDKNCEGGVRANCRQCVKEAMNKKYEKNPEPAKKRSKETWNKVKNNPELLILERSNSLNRKRKYNKRYPDRVKISQEKYKSNNIEKLRCKANEYNKTNPHIRAFHSAKRKQAVKRATPKWLTKDQWEEIKEFYKEAARLTKETGIPHEVDHIIPLLGEDVSGLHVPWNLRVLTGNENRKKSNKISVSGGKIE